jgi:hypothetical protein
LNSASVKVGEAWLLTTGVFALLLLACSTFGIGWTTPVLLVCLAIALVAAIPFHRVTVDAHLDRWNVVDLLTLVLIAGYTRFAMLGPPTDPDFVLIWGVKGKLFSIARAIDWRYLEWPLNNFTAHTDYPILLPLVYAGTALLTGGWNDVWLGLFSVLYGLAALLIVRGALRDELPRCWRVIATFALMPLIFTPYLGIAEGPLVAFALAGLLFIRRGELTRGAVYLGFAAFTKNEGLTLIVAAIVAMVIAGRAKEAWRLWPAVTIAAPWLILQRMHGLSNDLVGEGAIARVIDRLAHPAPFFAAIQRHPAGSAFFWLGVAVACAIGWRRVVKEERFLFIAIALQFLFFVAAYFASPHDLEWHVRWSWERIVHQLMPAVALLAIFANRELPGSKEEA